MNENTSKSVNCPKCNQTTEGNFCHHCGTPLTDQAAPMQWNAQTILPWLAIGISSVALIVAVVAFDTGKGAPKSLPHGVANMPAQTSPFALPLGSSFPAPKQAAKAAGKAPDFTTMAPQEKADRLFNRIMLASENGNAKEALVFVPMAIEAYNSLGNMDNDARYHLTLIYMVAGDIKNTRAQLEILRRAVPMHLLGLIVEYQIAEKNGNKNDMAKAYKHFLAAYESEILVGRAEYKDHEGSINRFRKRAQASVAEK